jgi:hypothetical protein
VRREADAGHVSFPKHTEDVARPAAEPHECFIAPQLAPRDVESEAAEADLALDHRIDPD